MLIIGLGNPSGYEKTRHNAGVWFIDKILEQYSLQLSKTPIQKTLSATFNLNNKKCRVLRLDTYMNLSGSPVQSYMNYYKIPPSEIVVIHDELDFEPGTIRIKQSGSAGGHNGLSDIIQKLNTKDFYRIRIGVGHPKDPSKVSSYVLNQPTNNEKKLIMEEIDILTIHLEDIVNQNWQKVMNSIHQKKI